jgi:hypothetical protein
MRSRDEDVPPGVAVERALAHGLCGIGGRLDAQPDSLTDALTLTDSVHGERAAQRLERFASAPRGAFVWTRDVYEFLWIGRIDGIWSYDTDPGAWAVDLVNVRPCLWSSEPVPYEEAPTGVLVAFHRGGRNWQQIRAPETAPDSARIWSRYGPDAPHDRSRT